MISTQALTTKDTKSTIYVPNDKAVILSWLLDDENVEYEMKQLGRQKDIVSEEMIHWIERCIKAGMTKAKWAHMTINSITTNFDANELFDLCVALNNDENMLSALAKKHTTTVPDGYDFGDELKNK